MTLSTLIQQHEILIRLGCFAGVFGMIALWEMASPCRELLVAKRSRWFSNLGLVVLDNLVLRIVFPVAATGFALWVESRGWGLLNWLPRNGIVLPFWIELTLTVVVLDLVIYGQHVLFHASDFFWRFHQVHHADLDYDVTTGTRFHPIEILFSMAIKCLAILLLGPSVIGVIVFEVILNATAMFNHANVSLPRSVDKVLRWLLVTPDMHRVHHSIIADEHNSNFGFNLPWWDRLFHTYCSSPRAGNTGMTIGLEDYRNPQQADQLGNMLLIPFRRSSSL